MSTKRQRIRSSSQGEVRVLTMGSPDGFLERKPIEAAVFPGKEEVARKKQKEEASRRRSIFTVGSESPEREEQKKKQSGEGFLEFLEKCRLCNKRFEKQTTLCYMYGYLGAYCSAECREDQMALDKFDEKVTRDSPIFKAARKPNCAS